MIFGRSTHQITGLLRPSLDRIFSYFFKLWTSTSQHLPKLSKKFLRLAPYRLCQLHHEWQPTPPPWLLVKSESKNAWNTKNTTGILIRIQLLIFHEFSRSMWWKRWFCQNSFPGFWMVSDKHCSWKQLFSYTSYNMLQWNLPCDVALHFRWQSQYVGSLNNVSICCDISIWHQAAGRKRRRSCSGCCSCTNFEDQIPKKISI